MKHFFTLGVLLFSIVVATKKSNAQLPPLYKFMNSTLDSGSANSVGAVYRFPNVITGVDALVKVTAISSGISLRDIDRTADGFQEAFQPEYRISGQANGYIDFKITFVNAGTSVIKSQGLLAASGLDIDGSSNSGLLLKEHNRIDMGGGTYEYNSFNSQIVVSKTGTAFTANNTTGVLFGALVDTAAKEVMYTVTSTGVATMTYRVGANNQMNGSSNRYASLYFNKFAYQHFPLAISNLLSFTGTAGDNKVDLKWTIAADKPCTIVLEKSNNAADFNTISQYQLDAPDGSRKGFDYTDNNIQGEVVYYRLRSTNAAGQTEYSNILPFRLNKTVKKQLAVYPSVIQTSATINITMTERENAMLLVTDFSGKVVKQQQVALTAGTNNITLNGFERFQGGNYIMALRTGAGVYTRQVIIQ